MLRPESESKAPWWRGTRGEWYVVVQVALFALIALGPRTLAGWMSEWHGPWVTALTALGVVMMVAGGALMFAAFAKLGKSLTPLPYPRQDGQLTDTGAYQLVRHPIYTGGLALGFGWALCVHGPLTFGYACLLGILLHLKSRREERWLSEKYPGYADYQKRVRRLVPFIY